MSTTNNADEVTLTNSATGMTPSVSATGTDTNISLLLKGKGTGGVAIMGYTDGSSASAGQVGEIISSAVVYTTASLTTATPANITNVPLTAGTWIVWGRVVFAAGASTTITYLEAGINSVSATLPNILTPIIGTSDTRLTATFSTGGTNVLSLSPAVIPISANTTIYLVGSANFGTSTMTAGGVIIAQRIR